jgi:hypothetical protein
MSTVRWVIVFVAIGFLAAAGGSLFNWAKTKL